MAKKLTTKEILAAARAKDADKAENEAPAEEQPEVASENVQEASEKPTAPKSTKDILAAARAQAGGASKETGAEQQDPPKKSGEAPKSTKDILAAARAQAGSGGTAAAEKPSGEKKAASRPAAASSSAGERPSVQEMLSAVREGKPAEEAKEVAAKPTPSKPILPPTPQKPVPAAKPKKAEDGTRRWFLVAMFATPLAIAWVFLTLSLGVWTLAFARFMMPNVLVEPPSKFKIGPPSDYPFGAVSTKWKSEFAVWIVHTVYNGESVVYALSTVCTHLGCTPNWLEAEQKFKCPCHGSGFYINGVNFEGPAPRPLERHAIQLAADGMLEIDKSMKFQEEMGQWDDSASFYVSSTS
jgi:cytochrome b6-f complex iron-sulfur subunit